MRPFPLPARGRLSGTGNPGAPGWWALRQAQGTERSRSAVGLLKPHAGRRGDLPPSPRRAGTTAGPCCVANAVRRAVQGRDERSFAKAAGARGRALAGRSAGADGNAGVTGVGGDCPKWGGMSKIWTMLNTVMIRICRDFGASGKRQEWTLLTQSILTYGRWGAAAQRGRTSVSASV